MRLGGGVGKVVVVDEARAGGVIGGVVEDAEGLVGATLRDGDVEIVVEGEERNVAGGEVEWLGDDDGGWVEEAGEEVRGGEQQEEEVITSNVVEEEGEVEDKDAIVEEVGAAEVSEVAKGTEVGVED